MNRLAIVYHRVSSDQQVKNSAGSLLWQQSMGDQARSYGWAPDAIQHIDEDLGISALSGHHRPGMNRLMDLVAAGKVGAIFVAEHTRAARLASEIAKLLELSVRNHTLFITNTTVYDLDVRSDRLTLGLLSEVAKAEIDTLRERSEESIRALLKTGKLRIPAPTGYFLDDDNQFIIDPQVKDEIAYIFQVFRETLSVRGTVKRSHAEKIKLTVKKIWKRQYHQTEPNYTRIHSILINPAFAGVYAYGKTVTTWHTPSKDALVKHVQRERDPEKWEACIKNHHEAYITFEEFIENQKIIERNCRRLAKGRSAVASGPALLQGLVWCSRCEQRLDTWYYQGKSRRSIYYSCRGDQHKRAGPQYLTTLV
ncbi:recombinase family protein [Deinococcus alpinitundrae]|uniref:recombinase family protein n=1 Tax=Deinococcus alpinitundrae TaxID=468913 RepID=UPI00137A3B20|nr:recombinase family protein [Deinococcus alpinitundrae]